MTDERTQGASVQDGPVQESQSQDAVQATTEAAPAAAGTAAASATLLLLRLIGRCLDRRGCFGLDFRALHFGVFVSHH